MSAVPESEHNFAEPVWSYRGYQLGAAEFTSAMIHLFRAEVSRANVWRQRLDMTTNWAVVTTGAVISFAFSNTDSSHIVILLNLVLVTLFLLIEARRYRYYELWSYRVRLMETDFFAAMLVPPFRPSAEWSEALAESLLHPQFPISESEAIGRRLRRNYLWIYAIIILSWLAKVGLFPRGASSLEEIFQRAALGSMSGMWVFLFVAGFGLALLLFGVATVGLRQSPGEILPRFGLGEIFLGRFGKAREGVQAWFRPTARRQQLLTMIITSEPDKVSNRILKDMRRGVTVFAGKGAFTGATRPALMVAMTVTEVPKLREIVAAEDPDAFVIVSPAQNIYGRGFQPLEEK
ncbi:MAG TPA: DUF2270 domain-containing protein [Anaerolineales bacterium]|jgi:uncharacterized membrane protein